MKKLVTVCLLALVGLAVGFAPAAQAYPEVSFHADVQPRVVFGGEQITASSSANVDCRWTQEWNHKVHRGSGMSFTSTFTAPKVSQETVIPVHFTCKYDATATRGQAKSATWTRSINVTVLPPSGAVTAPGSSGNAAGAADASGALPGTGGPNALFLVAGLLLLLAGAVAVKFARGRDDDAIAADAPGPATS